MWNEGDVESSGSKSHWILSHMFMLFVLYKSAWPSPDVLFLFKSGKLLHMSSFILQSFMLYSVHDGHFR